MWRTIKREELYEEVWSTPLCAKYGLSDNGLRKVCKRLNVPVPEGVSAVFSLADLISAGPRERRHTDVPAGP